jgi:tetratricopeptide (TPR) repeat protein
MPYAQHLQIVPIDKETVEAKLSESAKTPKLPQEIDISVRLEDASLKNAEIDILTIGKPSEFKVWQLPTVNPYFIPRPKLTNELKTKLPQKKAGEESARLLLTAATGMGGIGKTELARHYITNKELSDHYQRRFWLTATTASQIRNEFMQLAVYLGLVEAKKYIEDKELIHLIHRWLSINPGWLMVLDNADDYNSIASWIPTEGGAILVTTREPTPGTIQPEQIIPVPLLEPIEAITWLYQLSKRQMDTLTEQERIAAKQLVDNLGYLPLAIAQAAAYLREQTQVTIAEYQTRFTTLLSDPTLVSQDESKTENTQNDPDRKSRKIVASTWMLSLQTIENYTRLHNIPNIAKELLSSCAYYAPKNIPLLLLESCLKEFYQVESNLLRYMVDEYIGQLTRYSLLERNVSGDTIAMHHLVQQVIRDELVKNKKYFNYLSKGTSALKNVYPFGKYQMTDYALRNLLKYHLEEVLKYLDNSIKVEEERREIIVLLEYFILSVLDFLTDVYHLLVEPKKKIELLQSKLKIQEKYYDKNHVEVAKTLNNLGLVHNDLGDAKKAKELLENALTIQEKYYEKEHIEIARTLNNLANAYGNLGDAKKKKELLERAYENIKIYDVKKNIEVVRIMNNLANGYGALGDTYKKKELLEYSLKTLETHYGRDHIELVGILNNLGVSNQNLGDAKKAKELFERALKIQEEFHGKEHIEITKTLNNLVNAFGALNDVKKQKEMLEQVLSIQEKYYGKEHIYVTVILYNLADAYGVLGDVDKKKELLERVLKIEEKHHSKDHIDVAKTLNNLANTYGVLGDANKKKELLERSRKIKEVHYGKEHVEMAITLHDLAIAYGDLGDFKKKKELLEESLKIFEAHYGKTHIKIAETLNSLGDTYRILKDVLKAKELLERALQIKRVYYGNQKFELANTLANLSLYYFQEDNLFEAKRYMQRAYDILVKSPNCGETHPNTIRVKQFLYKINNDLFIFPIILNTSLLSQYGNPIKSDFLILFDWQYWLQLANQSYEQEDLEEAMHCYGLVIVFSPKNISAHHVLACLYHVQGNYVLAEQHFKQALTIKANAAIHCDYGLLFLMQKRYEEAVKSFLTVISMGNDGSGLMYGKLEINLLDKYLMQEINNDSNLQVNPFFLAHYSLIQCFFLLNDNILKDFYLNKLVKITQQFPSKLHYRILSYAYLTIGNKEKAEDYRALALSIEDIINEQTQLQSINYNQLYLKELSELIKNLPTALRYRLVSHIYSTIGNQEKTQEYMALAMSLEPTLEPQTAQQKVTSERTTNYNPTLFGENKATTFISGNSSQQELSAIQIFLRKAKILPKVMQNKEMVEVKFFDHRLIQQFADEIHKIGISNLSMKDEYRKPSVIIGGEGKEDEYIILLSADEYNKIMKDKNAHAKLVGNQQAELQLSFTL